MGERVRPEMAQTWRVEQGVGLIVNEQVFPWHVAADPPLMAEPIESVPEMHILWLPLLIETPLPEYGRPDAEPIDTAHPAETLPTEEGR